MTDELGGDIRPTFRSDPFIITVIEDARELLLGALVERGLRPMDGRGMVIQSSWRYGEPALVFSIECDAITTEPGEAIGDQPGPLTYRLIRWTGSVVYREVRESGRLVGYERVEAGVEIPIEAGP